MKFSPRITALPVIHGSGDFAVAVRRWMLQHEPDCVAVPLPPSFQAPVEEAVLQLPQPGLVLQRETPRFHTSWESDPDAWKQGAADDNDTAEEPTASYVPIDPCQPVIAALRAALGEHIPRAFVDLETDRFETYGAVLPDPYALKTVALERFAAATLPDIERPRSQQRRQRIVRMADRLRELEEHYHNVLFVCSVLDWPWVREAFLELAPARTPDDLVEPPTIYQPNPKTLAFLFGELPFITGLYERARMELDDDENLSVDGVKELLLAAREAYRADLKQRARKITPHTLRLYLKYVRNLALIERRMTPDLYSLVIAADQIMGDQFALHLAETAREYPYSGQSRYPQIDLGIDRGRLPDGEIVRLVNRLPGVPVTWRSCQLKPRPEQKQQRQWEMSWNPYMQCSWPPEDERIENFRTHVADRARRMLNEDLAKTEKFSTSLKDGLDLRETLRNWHTGNLYVREFPPSRGKLDCVVMLFDTPADPREYPWRTTWFAEHENESTLAFYASDFRQDLVGPGIGRANYGGAMFIFPPRHIPDIWRDRRLNFADTLEDRILAAACLHSGHRHIALVSPVAPGAGWRSIARRFRKNFIHLPLGSFSVSTIEQLRTVHVLNGHHIRSFAAEFIRKA